MEELEFKKITDSIDENFSCGNSSIDKMLGSAWFLCCLNRCYTYEIFVTWSGKKIILGYYMLTFKRFDQTELKPPLDDYTEGDFTDIYAINIECIAIDRKWQHHGLGTATLEHIIKCVGDLAEKWPIRILALSALEGLEGWYERFEFRALSKDAQNPETMVMYRDFLKKESLEALESFEGS